MGRRRKMDAQAGAVFLVLAVTIGLIMASPWLLLVPAAALGLFLWFREKKRRVRRDALLWAGDMDSMSGAQFEEMLEAVFRELGYGVKRTGRAGDFGADLVLSRAGRRIAVQAKRYSSNVGNKAVQEVYASMPGYGAQEGWVVTNSGFTVSAISQAGSCGVRLVDRNQLLDMIIRARKNHGGWQG